VEKKAPFTPASYDAGYAIVKQITRDKDWASENEGKLYDGQLSEETLANWRNTKDQALSQRNRLQSELDTWYSHTPQGIEEARVEACSSRCAGQAGVNAGSCPMMDERNTFGEDHYRCLQRIQLNTRRCIDSCQ